MTSHTTRKPILLLLPILAVALAFGVGVPQAKALSCPVTLPDKGIDCSGGGPTWSWCGPIPPTSGGSCQAEPGCPQAGDPAAYTRLNCTACACQCPLDSSYGSGTLAQLDCTGTVDNNCQARDLTCSATYHRNFACTANAVIAGGDCGSCLSGYIDCGAEICEKVEPPTWCQPPDVWDECTDSCSFKYVLSNFPTPVTASQRANPSIAGNLAISQSAPAADDGYLFLPNGGRIRVDDTGTSQLSIGNWDGGSTGFKMKLLGGLYSDEGISLITGDDSVYPGHPGTLEANQICLGDETACRDTWPIGLPEGIVEPHSTLRYEGATWTESTYLRNDESSLAVGVPVGESAGWTMDVRSNGGAPVDNAMINLDDRNGGLWTGLRLARVLGADLNKERWFLGMDNSNANFHLQHDGDIAKRYLTVNTAGSVGVGQESPQDKLHVSDGNLRLSRTDGLDATVKMTGTPLNRAWQIGYHASTGDFRLSKSLANLDLPLLTVANTSRYFGLNNASPDYPLDAWSTAGTAMMRLVQDTDTDLWVGLQMARKTSTDLTPVEKWYIGMPDAAGGGDKFLIRRNSTYNDLVIDTSGWVGLNDENPEAQLTVQGPQAGVRVENTDSAESPFYHLVNQGGSDYVMLVDANDNDYLKIAEGDVGSFVSRITLGDLSYIGLNNDAPAALLDMNNRSSGTSSIARINQDFAGTEMMGWQLDRQGARKWFTGMPAGDESYRIVQGGAAGNDRLIIDEAGNVGVGVEPAVQYKLDVNGGRIRASSMRLTSDVDGNPPSAGGGTRILGAKNTDGDLIWVDKPIGLPSSGLVNGQTLRYDGALGWLATLNLFNNGSRIGINETSPGYPLDIAPEGTSTDHPMVRIHGPSSGRRWTGLRLDRAKGSEQWFLGMGDGSATVEDEDFVIRRAGTDNPLTIKDGTGRIGIANGNPVSSFSVGERFNVDAGTGNVFIGAGAPLPATDIRIDDQNDVVGQDDVAIDVNLVANQADAAKALIGQRYQVMAMAQQSSVIGAAVNAMSLSAAAASRIDGGIFTAYNAAGTASQLVGVGGLAVVDSAASATEAYGLKASAEGPGVTNYAGYFEATGGTTQNYGVYSAAGNNYLRNWLAMGAGNDVPQYPIDIYSDGGNAIVRIDQTGNTMRQGLKLDQASSERWFIGMEAADPDLEFQAGGSVKAVIQADGKMGINKNDPATALDVNGRITTNEFTMKSGAGADLVLKSNAAGDAYWGVVVHADDCTGGKFHHLSTNTYNGNQGGYSGINSLCGSDPISGEPYHVCTAEDILRTVRCAPSTLPASPSQGWVSVGPPGFTTPAVNDCNGWTTNDSMTTKAYGAFWKFNGATGGYGASTTCNQLKQLVCCTPL